MTRMEQICNIMTQMTYREMTDFSIILRDEMLTLRGARSSCVDDVDVWASMLAFVAESVTDDLEVRDDTPDCVEDIDVWASIGERSERNNR